MFASWSRLLGSMLESRAYKQTVYVAAGSCCEILSAEEVDSGKADGSSSTASTNVTHFHQYKVNAALIGNLGKKVFLQASFILPSESPSVALQQYRAVWNPTLEAYYVQYTNTATTTCKSLLLPPSSKFSAIPLQHTVDEIQTTLRPTHFDWADEVNDEVGRLPCPSMKISVTTSTSTSWTSSETSSNLGKGSQPNTPITPFSRTSRSASPTFPSFEVAGLQHSRLALSLDLAASTNEANDPHESPRFEWLNLIQYTKECEFYREKNDIPTTKELWEAYRSRFSVSTKGLYHSGLVVALDLVIPKEPECLDGLEQANQDRTALISKYLDVHEHVFDHAVHLAKISAENEHSLPNGEVAGDEVNADGEEDTASEEVLKGEGKTGPSKTPSAFERIDLDAIFGGPADDLYEGYEAEHRAARANIDLAAHGTLNARDAAEDDRFPRTVLGQTPGRQGKLVSVSDTKNQSKPSLLDWTELVAVTQRAKSEGVYKHKPLQATARSRDWFWETTNDDNRRRYDPRIFCTEGESNFNAAGKATVRDVEEVYPHHLNYLQQPVFHKTNTPPEVSLWLVCSGQVRYHDPFSRQGVVSAQAGKLIDPFWYSGPSELLQCKGTQLRDEVTGYVDKMYHAKGTWILDQYDPDETVPQVIDGDEYIDIFNAPYWFYSPQSVYRMFYAKEARRLTDGNISLDPERADLEDPIVNDDGRMHGVTKPKSDGNWVLPPPSRLSIAEACMQETSDLEPVSPKPRQIQSSQFAGNQSFADHLEPILPEQSEEAVAAEDADFDNSAAVTVPSEPAEAEEGGKTSVEESDGSGASRAAATAQGPQLAEAEEGENCSSEESDVSAGRRAVRAMLQSPDFILTQRYVDAIADCKNDEAAEILALRNELRARAPAPNNTYRGSYDEEQVDYTDTWVRRDVRLVSNEAYLSQWSESAAVDERGDGDFLEEEAPAQGDVDCGISSPADLKEASIKRSFSIDDDATPEDLELERMDDESPMVISKLRDLGELPPPSPEGQRQFNVDVNVGEAFDAEQEQSQGSSVMVSSFNKDFFAKVLEEIRKSNKSFTPEGVDVNLAVSEDITALERRTNLPDEFFTSRGYDRPMTIGEENELLDRGHVAAMKLQEEADARADIHLNAYLGHLKRYHCKSWEATSDKVSTLEVVVPEDMESTSVLDEDSEEACERDPEDDATTHDSPDTEEYEGEVVSVGSEELANMSIEDLDALLSKVSTLLAIRQDSEVAGQDSSTNSDKALSVDDEEGGSLDQDSLEQEQRVEERAQLAQATEKLAVREKEMAEREARLAEVEKEVAAKEKMLAEEKAQLVREKELADPKGEDKEVEEEVVNHAFDIISCPSDIPQPQPTFNEHFFGSFAIAIGGKAARLAMGLSGILRSSATVLHRR
ncbi:hypothetical protein LPUS_04079 [Lasallia pustulata]|uniref:Uncharacterized protein n=1 Tax=Lasallia pustulata TaxID=136370 RepID=A0A1W5CW02_9LECA|nr:hypothetical protein LPUS_04079 [Lasallia pustulata]